MDKTQLYALLKTLDDDFSKTSATIKAQQAQKELLKQQLVDTERDLIGLVAVSNEQYRILTLLRHKLAVPEEDFQNWKISQQFSLPVVGGTDEKN